MAEETEFRIECSFLRFYFFTLRERGMEGEKHEARLVALQPLTCPPTEDLAHNPGMCPFVLGNQSSDL